MQIYLEHTGENRNNKSGKSRKYYLIETQGSDIYFTWGRIGSVGGSSKLAVHSHFMAEIEAIRKRNSKISKGYEEKEFLEGWTEDEKLIFCMRELAGGQR